MGSPAKMFMPTCPLGAQMIGAAGSLGRVFRMLFDVFAGFGMQAWKHRVVHRTGWVFPRPGEGVLPQARVPGGKVVVDHTGNPDHMAFPNHVDGVFPRSGGTRVPLQAGFIFCLPGAGSAMSCRPPTPALK